MITETNREIVKAVKSGLKSLERKEPLMLSEYADKYFYLSAESSYVQGQWISNPYQKGIMDCISNDDIREITWKKSARVGYTKIIVAAISYFAEHKKRSQAIWQPVDGDAEEFCKTEIDTMLRDVEIVRDVFPWYDKKHKNNTLSQKVFIGSTLYIRGAKAKKNFRRISVSVAYGDEIDAFDFGGAVGDNRIKLLSKRVEGATFPKIIVGSTPEKKGSSLIEAQLDLMECIFKFRIPCPKCDFVHPLIWGGKDVDGGMKWKGKDPLTAKQQCPKCKKLYTQSEYLSVWSRGVWATDDGIWFDSDNIFRNKKNKIVDTPFNVGFVLWTAYSDMTSWSQIVRDWLGCKGNPSDLKTFINETLGEAWEEDDGADKLEHETIYHRREHYMAECPPGVAVLTAGIDTQDDRIEIQVDGWGIGEERWCINYKRLYGDPSRSMLWEKVFEFLRQEYKKVDGTKMNIRLACQDHGGHYSDEVNTFSKKCGILWLIPIKGSSKYAQPLATFPRKRNKNGVYLTMVGTDTAKELLYQRLKIFDPGPGYWHFPINQAFDGEYFRQLLNESRKSKWVRGIKQYYWDANGKRQEPFDCSVYSLAAIRILQQHMGVILEAEKPIIHRRRVRSRGVH